jgi:hypothetical protein
MSVLSLLKPADYEVQDQGAAADTRTQSLAIVSAFFGRMFSYPHVSSSP